MTTLQIGMLILSTKGEDAALKWYNTLSPDERQELSDQLSRTNAAILTTFASISETIQHTLDQMLEASQPLLNALVQIEE